MATVSAATATTTNTLTPPSSSHGNGNDTWGYNGADGENTMHDKYSSTHDDQASRGQHAPSSNTFHPSYHSGPELATRKMQSVENLHGGRWEKSTDSDALSPPLPIESKNGRASPAEWPMQNSEYKRRMQQSTDVLPEEEANSKWIHRDKLAKIESQELQAAGIFVPRSRAPSKQRRDRSQSRLKKGPDSADSKEMNRSRTNSAAVEQRTQEATASSWDLRTPEEIAEEEVNAYFASTNGLMGGSRIPVAKTSPAPIPLDYLERNSNTSRKLPESSEDETILYPAKTRSRSGSIGGRPASPFGTMAAAKRSVTDMSPKKNAPGARKTSAPAKTTTGARPKSRSGVRKDSMSNSGTRPSTRSGDSAMTKQLEGDPPWMVNSYQPDPRLPPDQQLLPTVARRLRQEQWEKEGKFGDVYDKEFRPLNDNVFAPPEGDNAPVDEEGKHTPQQRAEEWPLKPDSAGKSPPPKVGSYSTIPRITQSPMPRMRTPVPPEQPIQQQPSATQPPQRMQEEKDESAEKGGCGCCVVM